MKKTLNGVLGEIDCSSLGYTLIHEHAVTCCDWSLRMAVGSRYCEPDVLFDTAVQKLKKAKAAGITTIVDGTPINLGRDVKLLKRAAESSGVNIIVSSGFYHHEDPVLSMKPAEELQELLLYECTKGLSDTKILPGIMKCAVDLKGFTDYIVKILSVTAKVANNTNLPIFCHTIPELKQGHEVLDLFQSYGIPFSSVIIGHSGDTDDLDYLESLLRRGCYLGMDRFGIVTATPGTTLEKRVDTVYQLCRRGWTGKLLISHDYAPYNGFFPTWQEAKESAYLNKPEDFTYFQNYAVPLLLKAGLMPDDIRQMTVQNPFQFFSGY